MISTTKRVNLGSNVSRNIKTDNDLGASRAGDRIEDQSQNG